MNMKVQIMSVFFSLKQIDNYDNTYLLVQGLNKTYNKTSNIIISTTKIDNKIYSFDFTVNNNNNEDCINYKDLIINSITIK